MRRTKICSNVQVQDIAANEHGAEEQMKHIDKREVKRIKTSAQTLTRTKTTSTRRRLTQADVRFLNHGHVVGTVPDGSTDGAFLALLHEPHRLHEEMKIRKDKFGGVAQLFFYFSGFFNSLASSPLML